MRVDWIGGIILGRRRSEPRPEEGSLRPYNASLPEPLRWCLAAALAKVSLVVVIGVSLLLLSGQNWHIGGAIDALIPDKFVKSLAADDAPRRIEAVEQKLGTDWGKVRSSARSPKTFGLGSTRQGVRAVQGIPDRESDSTWWYGDSEVYFAAGRVIGWKAASGSPLKAR